MAQIERRLDKNCLDSYFLQYAKDATSQGGEDGILEELFRLLSAGGNFVKYCIDIGAWDGKHLSNTYTLLQEQQWAGLLLEAEGSRFCELQQLYEGRQDVLCLQRLVSLEGQDSLASILHEFQAPSTPGFLCIDIDGADYHLWKSVASSCRAAVVCIEFNPTIPNGIFFVQAPQIEIQQGSSLLAIKELGQSLGYTLVVTTTFNAIFVRDDLCHLLPVQHLHQDIHRLHLPYMATEVFQTYDGELKYVGMKKLLWHKLALNPQKLQMLSKKDRKYPFAPTTTASYQGNFDEILNQFVILNSKSIFPKEVFQSLFALRQLPIIEGIATEMLHQLVFHQFCVFTNEVSSRDVLKEGVQMAQIINANAKPLIQTDIQDALRLLTLAKNVTKRLEELVSTAESSLDLITAEIDTNMANCHRLLGDFFSSWNSLLGSSQRLRKLSNSSSSLDSEQRTVLTKIQDLHLKESKKCSHHMKLTKASALSSNSTAAVESLWLRFLESRKLRSVEDDQKLSSSKPWRWLLTGLSIGVVTTAGIAWIICRGKR